MLRHGERVTVSDKKLINMHSSNLSSTVKICCRLQKLMIMVIVSDLGTKQTV